MLLAFRMKTIINTNIGKRLALRTNLRNGEIDKTKEFS